MPMSYPAHPAPRREQILELMRAGRTPEERAKEFEPTTRAIRNWMTQAYYRPSATPRPASPLNASRFPPCDTHERARASPSAPASSYPD
jgi:hypothetical protein